MDYTNRRHDPPDPETRNPATAATDGRGKAKQFSQQQGQAYNADSARATEILLDRIRRRVKIAAGGCWNWQGYKDRDGYGRFNVKGKAVALHRLTYELTAGPIPAGLLVHHACHNPACCNPDHLIACTPEQHSHFHETFASVNRRKTACQHWHPFDAANTYRHRKRRSCRSCNAAAVRRYKARKGGGK